MEIRKWRCSLKYHFSPSTSLLFKRGSFCSFSFLITWIFGDWALHMQQEGMGISFHSLKMQIIYSTSREVSREHYLQMWEHYLQLYMWKLDGLFYSFLVFYLSVKLWTWQRKPPKVFPKCQHFLTLLQILFPRDSTKLFVASSQGLHISFSCGIRF